MYFPTTAARRLSTVPALPNIPAEPVVSIAASPRRSLFCVLTRNGVQVWRVRPSAVLAFLSRTPTSVLEHGENVKAYWSPDAGRIVVQTKSSHLVLISLEYDPNNTVYASKSDSSISDRQGQFKFMYGAGEGLRLQSLKLHFEGVIRIDGILTSVSPRKQSLLFASQDPPAIQRIPWPTSSHQRADQNGSADDYDSWGLDEYELPWLVEPDVHISQILYSHATGVETWITSDGRVYFVQLRIEEGYIGTTDTMTSMSEKDAQARTSTDAPPSHDSASSETEARTIWYGTCVHNFETPRWVGKRRAESPEEPSTPNGAGEDSASGGEEERVQIPQRKQRVYDEPKRAVAIAINAKFSSVAIGTQGGGVDITNFPSRTGVTPKSTPVDIPALFQGSSSGQHATGPVCTMEWSSDGYVLAVGWKSGWAVFSVAGRCLASGFGVDDGSIDLKKFQDQFMFGVSGLFWAPGNFELIVLAHPTPSMEDGQLFVIPFAKSATTGQHSPDNTRYAFLQMDDRALVYRGADQPDMSIINPESDVWQHIKMPQSYLANNWPIRYSSLSNDGRLVAIAGRRGLIHYSSTSGRWKMFTDEIQEQAFAVKGGLVWFHHVLIAAVEVSKSYQIRLYSRDLELSNQNVLHREVLPCPVVIMSLVDNSLLVYTSDNTLHHYLIVPTEKTIKLLLCGSITFDGIIAAPNAVRLLSWMIPSAQKQLGDPMDDLSVATVLMMVGGQLVLLRPRKYGNQEVKYDLQVFADRIEFCWIHLRGIAALENSLWGYDGRSIRVWLNALSIEPHSIAEEEDDAQDSVKESVNIPLDFYPLSVLMDKGIIIGAEHEIATRSNLPFVLFRHATSSHLFLHHILRYHLESRQVKPAVMFASHYEKLVFFAHALEILLYTVVESEIDVGSSDDDSSPEEETQSQEVKHAEKRVPSVLHTVIQFLDHFDVALDVVVGCARKTEMTRWPRLFSIVGNPKGLFEKCLASRRLKTAASYLLVLHTLEQLDEDHKDVVRLLRGAIDGKEWQLCKELLRFLRSIDESGQALQDALESTGLLQSLHVSIGD